MNRTIKGFKFGVCESGYIYVSEETYDVFIHEDPENDDVWALFNLELNENDPILVGTLDEIITYLEVA